MLLYVVEQGGRPSARLFGLVLIRTRSRQVSLEYHSAVGERNLYAFAVEVLLDVLQQQAQFKEKPAIPQQLKRR